MDVGTWLRSLGLERYDALFRDHEIDAEVLPELSDADLVGLGIPLGPRKKLLKAIAALGRAVPAPALAAAPATVTREAERRQLTVMFCDLVGSTALSARLDPEDLRDVIGAYHRCVTDTVGRYDGFVAKYMGDGVLVYFGYPQAHEDDAERAVRAGLALVDAVGRLQAPEPLRVRVGVGTGLVVVGDLVTSGEGQERGVVGETPNLAARLQALAEPDAVVIGPRTRRLIGDLFEYRDLGAIEVKGFPEPVHTYQVVRESTIQSRFEALHGATLTPLVGREEEIDLLQRQWHRAKRGEGRVVLLSGEPGIGKSRLTAALQERIENEPHTRLRYFCSPHHQDSALHPIIAQLERAAGFEREDTPEGKLDKLAVLTPASPEDGVLLAELLSLPTEGRLPPLQLTPRRKKEKTFEALLRQLEALAQQRPVLMLFEDVHWIDPSSRELLDLFVERVPRLPVLLLVTFRPQFQPPWTGQAHVTVLVLNRLDRRDGAALVRRVVGTEPLPGAVVAEIVERADGVPLFVEELTKLVLEGGNTGTVLSRAGEAALKVPATLHASLMARLDRLGSAAKEVAQVGAALGREFSYEVLATVAQRNAAELDAALDQLVAAGLVFQRGMPPQATFLFKHALVQDAAYGTLVRGRRREWHARIASALQARAPETADTQPEVLAHHLSEAGRKVEASKFWVAAGDRALRQAANREAAGFYERALACREEQTPEALQETVTLRRKLHQALYPIGELQRDQANLEEAARIAEQLKDPVPLCRVLASLTYLLSATGAHSAAITTGERALSLLSGHDDLDAMVGSQTMLARALYAMGRYREAVSRAKEAIELLGEDIELGRTASAGDLNETVVAHVWLALCYAELGEFEIGAERGETAVRLAAECGEHGQLWSRVGLGRLKLLKGDLAGAIEVLTPALPLCKGEFAIYFSRVASSLGAALAGCGRAQEGLELLKRADARALEIGFTFGHALVLAQLTEAFLGLGDLDQAQEAGLRALEAARRWGERGNEGWAGCALAAVAAARNDVMQAQVRYEEALSIAEQLEMEPLLERSRAGLNRLAAAKT